MKIDATQRINESLASGVSFEEQLAAAKASGRRYMKAILPDGRRAIYFYTDAENAHIDGYNARTPTRVRADSEAELAEIKQRLAALEAARVR